MKNDKKFWQTVSTLWTLIWLVSPIAFAVGGELTVRAMILYYMILVGAILVMRIYKES